MSIHYFQIADITLAVTSDLPIEKSTFHPKFEKFAVEKPGNDLVRIHHHFDLLDTSYLDPAQKVYEHSPWAIYESPSRFTYVWTSYQGVSASLRRAIVFSRDHTHVEIFNDEIGLAAYTAGNVRSLTLMPTDQILMARLINDRQGCILHSCGLIMDDKGLMFVGHSDAGKSTIATLMRHRATILCDDRNIIKKDGDKFRLYGTWSHGDVEDVSGDSADLEAIYFLHQATENRIEAIVNKQTILPNLLACMVKPFVRAGWWNKTLDILTEIMGEVPCYDLYFDKSGGIVDLLEGGVRGKQ